MAIPIKRDQWVTAKIKVTKAGKILAKVPPSAIKNPQRVRNVAEGFMDAKRKPAKKTATKKR